MAAHAEYALRGPSIFEVFYLPLAVAAAEAACTEGLVPREDGEILDLVIAGRTAVGTAVADQRAVAEQEEICVGV